MDDPRVCTLTTQERRRVHTALEDLGVERVLEGQRAFTDPEAANWSYCFCFFGHIWKMEVVRPTEEFRWDSAQWIALSRAATHVEQEAAKLLSEEQIEAIIRAFDLRNRSWFSQAVRSWLASKGYGEDADLIAGQPDIPVEA